MKSKTDVLGARIPPIRILNSEQNLAGANCPIPITRAPPPTDFCTMFRLNEANQADGNIYASGKPGVPQTHICMFLGVVVLCNSPDAREFVAAGASASMASAIYVPSGSVVTTGLVIDSSPYLGPNEVYQFNTDEFEISQDGLPVPPTSRNALETTQGPPLFSSVEKVGQSGRSMLTLERSKRPCIAYNPVKADKKPRFAYDVHVDLENLQLKELPFLDNFVESTSSAETGDGAEVEDCPADLNMSPSLD
ncbi:hypothetical protein V6N12_025554 [Hibiscus sabdariffa]|uniref:Uncharacterized protein n=1 Tax=Hibiscus sabdariffa TaxID=183260 RepID=A0ABR2CIU9_9ROSI